jgi:hypothetical protein
MKGKGNSTASEDTFTNVPRAGSRRRNRARAAWLRRRVVSSMVSSCSIQVVAGTVSNAPKTPYPALCITRSNDPPAASAATANAASLPGLSRKSSRTGRNVPGPAQGPVRRAGSRAVPHTVTPSSRSIAQKARPKPLLAPVTKAVEKRDPNAARWRDMIKPAATPRTHWRRQNRCCC